MSNSLRKPVKKFLHLKLLTLQNVRFKMSEYSDSTIVPFQNWSLQQTLKIMKYVCMYEILKALLTYSELELSLLSFFEDKSSNF